MGLRRFLILTAAAAIILLAVIAWFYPTTDDFRLDNPFWNGIKNLASDYAATPLYSLSNLPDSPRGSTLILVPYLDYTPAELERIGDFVSRGGTLVLADDYGYGNHILEHLGMPVRFSQQPLLDPVINFKNQQFPRITHVASSPLTANVTALVLNHATTLVGDDQANILAQSSWFSFLDLNANGIHDADEPTGPFPVISRHNRGNGTVVLVADPSLFINSMQLRGDNAAFLGNIAATATKNFFLDQSHLPVSDMQQTKNLLTQMRGYLTTLPGAALAIILILTLILIPVWYRRKQVDRPDSSAAGPPA